MYGSHIGCEIAGVCIYNIIWSLYSVNAVFLWSVIRACLWVQQHCIGARNEPATEDRINVWQWATTYAAVDLEVTNPGKAAVPRAPDLGGERVRPPDSAPYLDPSFQNTAPPSQPAQHNEDTRFPLLFWTLYSPWTLLCIISV